MALLALCALAGRAPAQSAIFQSGVSPAPFDETMATVIAADAGAGFAREGETLPVLPGRALLAFPGLVGPAAGQLPPGAVVTQATLHLRVLDVPAPAAGPRWVELHPLFDLAGNGPWIEPAAAGDPLPSSGANWLYRDARPGSVRPWLLPGGDRATFGAPFSAYASVDAAAVGTFLTLDVTSVVQAWAEGYSNLGWSLDATGPAGVTFASDEHPDASWRPRLAVSWSGTATPSNALPEWPDRSHTTPVGTPLFLPFPLVDDDGDALQVVVVDAPDHGSLEGQGWFSYVPSPGYSGPDAFTVYAYDGFATTRLARVQIDVQPAASNETRTYENGGAVRATSVAVTLDPQAQLCEESDELRLAAGSWAAFVDFPALRGGPDALPTGAVVLGAQLECMLSAPPAGPLALRATPLLDPAGNGPWVEPATGGANAGVSWLHRDARPASLTPWIVPGGEEDALRAASASLAAPASGDLVVFDVTAAVQRLALGQGGTSFRLQNLLPGELRLGSDEHPDPNFRPRLVVTYRTPLAAQTPLPPVTHAGPDQRIPSGTQVQLDGSASYDPDGSVVAWLWTQTAGPAVTLDDPTSPTPTFLSPTVGAATALRFSLWASDGQIGTLDDVEVTVTPPLAGQNLPPAAVATAPSDVLENRIVLLDASASIDPESQPLTFNWEQMGGPAVTLNSVAVAGRAFFTAPVVPTGEPLLLHFKVSVSDGVHLAFDWVQVRVHKSANQAPQALVSPNQVVRSGQWVGLDALGSTDPDPNTSLTFAWAQTSGPAVTLGGVQEVVSYFRAPTVSAATALEFQVLVSDGIAQSPAACTVTVLPAEPQFLGGAQSLAPYRDTLTAAEARHLMRRTGYGASPADIEQIVNQGLAATLAQLLTPTNEPLLDLAAWAHLPAPEGQDVYPQADADEVAIWWLTYKLESQWRNQLREKIAYFWHDLHAASGRVAGSDERHWVMEYLDLFRNDPFPTYRDFLIALTRNSLMLDWLDGHDSVVGAPNENWAREFWELFTLGELHPFTGLPNYTEADIQEAARAFTGWERYRPNSIAGDSYYSRFDPARFDPGLKSVFGILGAFEDTAIVDITLARAEAAEFLCYRLFVFFVHDQPDYTTIQQLATVLTQNNWEIEPVLQVLLRSEAFFSPAARRAHVKTATEYLVGFSRETGLRLPVPEVAERLRDLNHELGNPPSVKGWEEGVFLLGAASSSQRAQAINAFAYSTYLGSSTALDRFLPPAGLRNSASTIARMAEVLDLEIPDAQHFGLLMQYMDTVQDAAGVQHAIPFDGDDPAHIDRKVRGLLFLMAVGNPEYQLN